jgi:protein tyrosine/serine phosphatase
MRKKNSIGIELLICWVWLVAGNALLWAAEESAKSEVQRTLLPAEVGEKVPSEHDTIKDFHSLGLVGGRTGIYRSACPVRELAKTPTSKLNDEGKLSAACETMRQLRTLGIKTIISFEDPNKEDPEDIPYPSNRSKPFRPAVALEREAAEREGIRFVSRPIINAGKDSLEDMSDEAVVKLLDDRSREIFAAAEKGGVLFHCSAGHDRTGIVSAYIRIKYQHWPVEEAIAEMRRYGHNWPRFSHDGGKSSWHETHLRVIGGASAKQTTPVPEAVTEAP